MGNMKAVLELVLWPVGVLAELVEDLCGSLCSCLTAIWRL